MTLILDPGKATSATEAQMTPIHLPDPADAALGKRLRFARESVGMARDEAARAAGISEPLLAELEAGIPPSWDVLDRLADIYARSDYWFALEDRLPTAAPVPVGLTGSRHERDAILRVLRLTREVGSLRGLLNGLPSPPPTKLQVEDLEPEVQGYRLAQRERTQMERTGIWTASAALPAATLGICLMEPEVGAVVVVNSVQSPAGQRHALARGWAHVLLDLQDHSLLVMREDQAGVTSRRAVAFAHAVLDQERVPLIKTPEGLDQQFRMLGRLLYEKEMISRSKLQELQRMFGIALENA